MTAVAGGELKATGAPSEERQSTSAPSRAARLGVIALVAVAPAGTLYLSFSNGGYFPNSVGIVVICLCAVLVLRTTLADRPFEGYTRLLAVALLAMGLFALLQLVSISWSHSAAPALDDYDRTLLYLLVLALFGSLPRSTLRLSWLVRALAGGMSAVCLAALVTRVLPHLWPTPTSFYADRLDYPLGYWNALGMMAALTCTLLLHLASHLQERWPVRVVAAGLFPAAATTALLTYSRGALGVAILGLIVYAVVGRPRGLVSGLVAIGPATALALHSGYNAVLLSGDNPTSPAAVAQGRHVAAIVGLSMLLAAGLRGLGLLLDRWLARPHPPPAAVVRMPRWAMWSTGVAALVIALILAGAPGFISREFNRFAVDRGPSAAQTRDRLTDPASNGRIVLWQVALHQFSQHPLVGDGAGTYRTYFAEHRTDTDTVTDTHSLYLQTLGEDGVAGLILLAIALVCIVGTLAWRVRGPRRSLYGALFAVALAWAVHNAVDWDWQMPAVTLWLFAVGGLVMARRRPSRPGGVSRVNRTALAASFLALAIAPLLIGFSYQRLRAAGNAFVSGNCAEAKRLALSSISLLAVRPQAYEILGYCDLQQSYPIEGLAAMRKAASYDQQDWEYHYSLAIALGANGVNPLSESRLALRLNPRQPIAQTALRVFEGSGRGWVGASHVLMVQTLESGALSVSQL